MVARRLSPNNVSRTNIEPLIQLWLFRLLIPMGCHRKFVQDNWLESERIAEALELGNEFSYSEIIGENEFNGKAIRNHLHSQYRDIEKRFSRATVGDCLAGNIKRLSSLVGLTVTDCRILEFVVLIHNEHILQEMANYLGDLTSVQLYHELAVLLDIPENEVRLSLNAKSILTQSGLVSVERRGASTLIGKLDLLSNSFADHILSEDADPVSLLRDTVFVSTSAQLKIDDFEHISAELNILKLYLRKSISTNRVGVNIFLHGIAGTGKSQLVKVLAEALKCELFEVASEDEDGDSVNGELRLRAFRAAQNFFSSRQALILFDEVEDVFNDGFWGRKSTAQTRKAWINRMLEENPVPTFWLSNSADCLDQAFIRRFDMVIELSVPPRKQRHKIIKNNCSDFLSNQLIDHISESEALAPAIVTRAASVVQSIKSELGASGVPSAFELIINNTLETQGHKAIRKSDPNRLPETYDPAYIHADTDIVQVGAGLTKAKSGRLCLYGAPGTGKTAYGRWIAEQIGTTLIVKRASDLISMWVGGTEKNIANAFREAEVEGAVLQLDEVDSFLQDRRCAGHSWEVSQVNEMLTQMESFSGVFIATTNLMTGLDQAALRRFDLKIKFGFLKQEQAWNLLQQYCKSLAISKPNKSLKISLDALNNLTPGDYAAVARRHRFNPITSAKAMIDALAAECVVKEGAKRTIGFIH